eukprot:365478-Chlamydomonas_euryale.AAC.12
MYSGGSPELQEGPPAVCNDVVAEASLPPAQPAEALDLTTTATSDRCQKHARSPAPQLGTSLLTRYFPVTSQKLSSVPEGARKPGARVVAGTAAAAPNAAQGSSGNTDEWSACGRGSRMSSGQ